MPTIIHQGETQTNRASYVNLKASSFGVATMPLRHSCPSSLFYFWYKHCSFICLCPLCVPAVVGASLTESTLKIVPQVVNVQELKEKGPPVPASNIIRYNSEIIQNYQVHEVFRQ